MRFGRKALRWLAFAALVAGVLIVVGGVLVRVTGSGLGCPEWPRCTADSFGATAETGRHGVIEFANRLVTTGLCVIVGLLFVVARWQVRPVPEVVRWVWVQVGIVGLNAVVGGVTVLARLSPYVVAAHFLAAVLLLTAATVTWDRVLRLDTPGGAAVSTRLRALGRVLIAATAALTMVGAVVTGTGPHAGDSARVTRMPLPWTATVVAHGLLAALVLGTVLAMRYAAEPGTAVRERATILVLVLAGQGGLGVVQAFAHLPGPLVFAHVAVSALLWIGAVRLYLDTNEPVRVGAGR
ncbi:cytochrome c oxidase assembly protein subunit 15 [Nocardia pseudobrasiliensis]|uniref:Cytochrome c oxidase assembly protein subunit 15 n=1 Tax=Nocardia pseudobrasiliensis TaxID=45979 RepID=A0A370I944_9NOCA|nr:cytochrome c oxidase assembly protein subunit 15 [Nocardia pseudobrasiliensis]